MPTWRIIGRLPSTAVILGMILSAGVCKWLLSDDATVAVAIALFGVFVLHCVARPARGGDVFGLGVMPSCVSLLVSDITGVSRQLIGLPLIAVMLVLLWQIDRETRPIAPTL